MTRTLSCRECGAPFELPAGPGRFVYCPEHSGPRNARRRCDEKRWDTPVLTKREALLVRELAMRMGRRVPWPILADATGTTERAQIESIIHNIRRKFGRDSILSEPWVGYYVEARRNTA